MTYPVSNSEQQSNVIILASILFSHHQQMLPKNSLLSVRCGLSWSCTLGTEGLLLQYNKSRYGPVLFSGKWLGNQVHHTMTNLLVGPMSVPFLPSSTQARDPK
jgi:hypothetical protein